MGRKKTALFMTFLIVMIPIYSSLVIGDIFRIDYIGGASGAFDGNTKGYMAEDDTSLIAAIISDIGDVRCTCDANSPLQCEAVNGTFQCVYQDLGNIDAGSYSFSFYRLRQNSPLSPSIPVTLIVDDKSPTISNFAVDIKKSKVKANVNAVDTAYDGAGSEECSGISKIDYFLDGSYAGAYNRTIGVNTCRVNGAMFDYPLPSDGWHDFYAEVYDYVGHVTRTDIARKYVDTTPPKIRVSYLQIGSTRVDYISSSELSQVNVFVELYDYNMSGGAVFGDLSELTINPAKKAGYTNIEFTCINKEEGVFKCRSNNKIDVIIPAGESAEFELNMTDANKNNGVGIGTITLTRDDSSPILTLLGTSNCDSDKCYIRKGQNTVEARISDTGAGFGNALIYFKLPGVGSYQNPTKLAKCEELGSLWICQGGITVNLGSTDREGSQHELTLVYPSQDDVGNIVAPQRVNLVYDSKTPELSTLRPIKFMKRGTSREYLASYDRMKIELLARDDTSGVKTAKADLSQIIPGAGWVDSNPCQSVGGDEYKCVWLTGSIRPGPKTISGVEFKIFDFAGNALEDIMSDPLTIYTAADSNDTFWEYENTTTDPPFLDRIVSQYVPGGLNVWAKMSFVSEEGVKLLNAEISDCDGVGHNFLKSSRVYPLPPQTIEGTTADVFTVLEIRQTGLPDDDELLFACNMSLTSAKGTTVYPPEIVEAEVRISLDTYGFDIPSDYENKIADFKSRLEDKAWLDSLNKLFTSLEKICKFFKTLVQGFNVLSDIYHLMAAIFSKSSTFTAWLEPAMLKSEDVSNAFLEETIFDKASWFCGFFDCTLMDKIASSSGQGTAFQSYSKWLNTYVLTLTSDVVEQEKMAKAISGVMDANDAGIPEASKNSIIVSSMALCIPGIIYNIEKARQIDCMYVDCAQRWTQTGFNPYTCEAMRSNAYCNFVYGQIFHIVPFSGVLEALGKFMEIFTSSPFASAGMIQGYFCARYEKYGEHWTCRLPKRISTWTTFFTSEIVSFKSFSEKGTDYCSEIGI